MGRTGMVLYITKTFKNISIPEQFWNHKIVGLFSWILCSALLKCSFPLSHSLSMFTIMSAILHFIVYI